jgi:hypothetical protein
VTFKAKLVNEGQRDNLHHLPETIRQVEKKKIVLKDY